ncbi:hypothetical protein PAXRUDRAFT_143568 [Paxillus rubicundulus Ve08.2h10]|uniref:Uncharacterized protein n=1 Tax=Paxillus rubicundulus Ve08.2h10 TaxID=930991 RepID=A0A0D0E1F4_9AGAM|nr:hypothetical protein PAXRUDRAFT_143568 [Paxillus rubicundulus Ve08.2h10]
MGRRKRKISSWTVNLPWKKKYRFASQSRRFIDAYQKGLNGQRAAKKYHGHQVLPPHTPQEFDKAHQSST